MHREPEVPEAGVPVVERLDGLARITSKEFATTHAVKNGTLQNACSTRQRVVAVLGKSALMHTARLMNSVTKRSKKNGDKSAVAMLKNYTTIMLRLSRYGAAEVYNDFAEELKHAEANPICSIHKKPCYVTLTFETRIHRLE